MPKAELSEQEVFWLCVREQIAALRAAGVVK